MHANSVTRAVGIVVCLAVVSALLSAFVPPIDALMLNLRQLGIGSTLDRVPQLPGILFGIVLAVAVYVWGRQNPIRALSAIVTSMVAWTVAVYIAATIEPSRLLAGLTAGAVGATLTSIGIALAVPAYRRPISMASTIVVGALSGLLLYFMGNSSSTLVPLYVVWQSTVAATIVYGIVTPKMELGAT